MARFYGSIQGNRGEATRCGSKESGITGHIRGWDVGVEVECKHRYGMDEAHIFATGGSNGGTCVHVATVKECDKGGRDLSLFPPDGSPPLHYHIGSPRALNTCIWCGMAITNGAAVSGWTNPGPDWMVDGDFGCGESPVTDDDGMGGHMTTEEAREIVRLVETEECGRGILARMRINLYVTPRLLGNGKQF